MTPPIEWIIYYRNTRTLSVSSFTMYGKDRDDAITNVVKEFFDHSRLLSCDLSGPSPKVSESKGVIYPSKEMRLLGILHFDSTDDDSIYGALNEARERWG